MVVLVRMIRVGIVCKECLLRGWSHASSVKLRRVQSPLSLLTLWQMMPLEIISMLLLSLRPLHTWEARVQVYAGRKEWVSVPNRLCSA